MFRLYILFRLFFVSFTGDKYIEIKTIIENISKLLNLFAIIEKFIMHIFRYFIKYITSVDMKVEICADETVLLRYTHLVITYLI